MTKLIENLRAYLFGTSEPPLRSDLLPEHVHLGRRTRAAGDVASARDIHARSEAERAELKPCV